MGASERVIHCASEMRGDPSVGRFFAGHFGFRCPDSASEFPSCHSKKKWFMSLHCACLSCVLLLVEGVGLVVQSERSMCARSGEARSHIVRTSHELCLMHFSFFF